VAKVNNLAMEGDACCNRNQKSLQDRRLGSVTTMQKFMNNSKYPVLALLRKIPQEREIGCPFCSLFIIL